MAGAAGPPQVVTRLPRWGDARETNHPAAGAAARPEVVLSAAHARTLRRDADFSRAVLEDLYRYPRKRLSVAYLLWLTTGVLGGHRFYVDRIGTGIAMLFTGGGGSIWWFADLFFVRKMVEAYNGEQAAREDTGLPPRSLEFMPPLRGAELPPVPEWIGKRGGRARLVGDLIVLLIAGTALGAFAAATTNFEAVIAVLALIAITNLGARWDALATMPILRGFDRWNHRLRLFYYTNDPGGPLSLALRPIFGILSAPLKKRARAEARLYLQLGAWFTIIFTLLDVVDAVGFGSDGFSVSAGGFLRDMVMTFVSVYAFAAPIGAILTTHLLLERRDWILWMLSGVAVFSIASGLLGGG